MIIKKKKLDMMSGASNQEPAEQQYVDNMQEGYSAQEYEQENQEYNPAYDNQLNQTEYPDSQEYTEPVQENYYPEQEIYKKEYPENIPEPATEIQTTNIQTKESSPQAVVPAAPVQPKPLPPKKSPKRQPPPPPPKEEEINLFDLDNIDFSQRQERRRGDRRRGFRRVDDRNLVSRAREEADSIRESAMKEGYQAGLDQAQADIEEFRNALGEFVNAKQEVFEYIAPDILEISVDIAQKIVKKEIEQSPQVLFNTIVDVLKTSLSKEETKVTLRVNPAEVNEVKQAVPELINLAGIDTKIVVLADEEVTEGGCQVTTTNGIVDATVESRMRVVTQALREL